METGREIVWDTETTGVHKGCKVVEIGAIELQDMLPTGRFFHEYIDPGIPMPKEAERIHGISDAMLAGKPKFKVVIPKFLKFIRGATLIAHNAPFDVRVINDELAELGLGGLTNEVIDTIPMARRQFPAGAKVNLDALCAKFKISTAHRKKHGALLDSELLAEALLHLRGGRQRALDVTAVQASELLEDEGRPYYPPGSFRHHIFSLDELARHVAFVDTLKNPIWNDYMTAKNGEDEFGIAA